MKKVLVPIDSSEVSEEALRYAVECACAQTREWGFLHVIDPLELTSLGSIDMVNQEDEVRQELLAATQQHLDELVKKYARKGLNFKPQVVYDRPWRGIINVTIEDKADTIVMGFHGRGQVAELLLGSVAERVVRNAPVPVSTIRPGQMRERLIENWHHLGKG